MQNEECIIQNCGDQMNASIDVTNVVLETPRLVLRPWQERDIPDMFEYASVPGVGEMAGWPHHHSLEDTCRVVDMFIRHKKVLALELKDNGKVIGSLGIEELENEGPELEHLLGRELGYVLSKAYWGRGLMPEAVRAVIDYCFRILNYDILTCGHFVGNAQSQRVIEKCGFRYLKQIQLQTSMGTTRETRLYVLLCTEYDGDCHASVRTGSQ